MTYQVHPRQQHRETLIHVVNGRAVNLAGTKTIKHHPAIGDAQAWDQPIPAASQRDLQFVHESGAKDVDGFLIVIKVDQSPKPVKKATKKGSEDK